MRDRFSSNALGRMGRRGFLKTLAGLGISASTASALTQSAVAEAVDDPRREVPRIRAFRHTNHEEVIEEGAKPEREPDVYTIPRWRWARIEAAHDARRRVERQLDGKYPVWVTTDNNGEKKIVVEQHDDGNLRSADVRALDKQVPASVNGVAGHKSRNGRRSRFAQEREIPVDIKRPEVNRAQEEIQNVSKHDINQLSNSGPYEIEAAGEYYVSDYDPVPGGAASQMIATDSNYVYHSYGTTGTPVFHDGSLKMLSVAHLWNHPNPDPNPEGAWIDETIDAQNIGYQQITQPTDFSQGEAVFDRDDNNGLVTNVLDAGVMNLEEVGDVAYDFAAEGGVYRGKSIVGGVSQQRINDLEDMGTALSKQGATTGLDPCHIIAVNSDSFQIDQILGYSDGILGGDSGGPITEPFGSDTVDVVGIVQDGNPGYPAHVVGVPSIEDELGVIV